MSRSAKIFFGASAFTAVGVIYGVHWLQRRESDTMYQGVLRDEARLKEKALKLAQSTLPPALVPASLLSTDPSSSSSSSSSSPQANSPSTRQVSQPEAIVDPDCQTCHISPPPQLLESSSAEERRKDRAARAAEYEAQKDLGVRLGREQGGGKGSGSVGLGEEGRRLV